MPRPERRWGGWRNSSFYGKWAFENDATLLDSLKKRRFDGLFDLNRDGVLDPAEQGYQLDFITRDMNEQDDSDDSDF